MKIDEGVRSLSARWR